MKLFRGLFTASLLGLTAAAIMAFGGCGKSAEEKLIGQWEGSFKLGKTSHPDPAGESPDGEPPAGEKGGTAVVKWLLNLGSFWIDVRRGGEVDVHHSTFFGTKTNQGRWEVLQDNGTSARVRITGMSLAEKVDQFKIQFLDEDNLLATPIVQDIPAGEAMRDVEVYFRRRGSRKQ